jgi:hypothetical protein
MQEEFLHFIFKNRLWENDSLQLINGEELEIQDTGLHNFDSGPDFFNARIKTGDTVWVGNVEIHVNSSDWYKHNHHKDFAYNNVILHVVYNYDKPVILSGGDDIPTWEIRFPHTLFNKFSELKINPNPVPCHDYIELASNFKTSLWFDRMAAERLQIKAERISNLLQRNNDDFEQAFYQSLARSFGFGINSDPFEQLSFSMPLSVLRKYHDNIFKTEALLFGQSGLLEEAITDNYVIALKKEYTFLRTKHNLSPLPGGIWKKSRLRPGNFPQVRIAQFAALMTGFQGLFSSVFEEKQLSESQRFFNTDISEYWHTHYLFGKPVDKAKTGFGIQAFHIIAINTIAPFAFYYFNYYKKTNDAGKVTDWLCSLKAEDNRETRVWKIVNITADNAYESQALINLKKNYCDVHKCLDCAIGNEILKELNKI